MVEALSAKTTAWEKEKGNEFKYDGVSIFHGCLYTFESWSSLTDDSRHHLFSSFSLLLIGQTFVDAGRLHHHEAGERARAQKTEGIPSNRT